MVLLDVQVVEIPSSRLRELGVRWDGTTQGGLNAALAWDAGSLGRMARPGEQVVQAPASLSSAAGYFGVNALLSARIAALAQSGEAVMLEQLRIIMGNHAEVDLWRGCKVRHLARRVKDQREAIDVGTGSDTPPGGRADDDGE